MAKDRSRVWFGCLPDFSEEFAAAVLARHSAHTDALRKSHRHNRMQRSWSMYYSKSRDGGWDDTEVRAGGKQGQLTLITPGQYRNLIQHQLVMVTQVTPSYEAIAINTDSESLSQAQLGNGVIEYYNKSYGVDDLRVKRAEVALVMGESFFVINWDYETGNEFGVRERKGKDGTVTQMPAYEGDLAFSVRTPYEVAYDPLSPDLNRPRWTIVREPANKWDLAETFPEFRDEILDAESWTGSLKDWSFADEYEHDDYTGIYRVTFEKSPARRDGRQAIVLNNKTVLIDENLTTDRAGVFRLAPADVIMQSGGYTNNFDVMPIAETYGKQLSTVLTNHATYGTTIIASPKGTHVKPHHIAVGVSLLEYDFIQGAPPPQAISLLPAQQEHLTFLDVLKREMETLSAINPVVRGEVSSTKGDSGSKDALIQASAQQFSSGFAGSLRRSDEAAFTHILATLKTHATTKRVAVIGGKYNSYASQEFTGADLAKISRVIVRAADASRDTTEGREMFADKLLQIPGGIATAEQYIMVRTTGRLEPLYEGKNAIMMNVRRENEMLRDGELPVCIPSDAHLLHIQEHVSLLADPGIRKDPKRWQPIQAHIDAHLNRLTPDHPDFAGNPILAATEQKAFPPANPVANDDPNAPPLGDGQGEPATPPGAPHPPGSPDHAPPPGHGAMGRPDMPRMPVNPATGQRVGNANGPPPPTVTQA